jgi:mannosylglycerate hydrolase
MVLDPVQPADPPASARPAVPPIPALPVLDLRESGDPAEAGGATAATPAGSGLASLAGFAFSIVPHTHWDREWYLPFEVFRMRLVRATEEILDVLETDPRFTCFTLDGQATIVDDVLELRPDLEPRIAALARDGRLALGPGYVLPDEFLVGAETLIRNLLAGRAAVRRLGAEPMAIGYQPDPFGHVAQLPQILRGFGLDGFVFSRGLGDEVDRIGPVFRWQGPDGSWVFAVRQLDGYSGGSELGRWAQSGVSLHDRPEAWAEAAAHRFVRFVRRHHAAIGRGGLRHVTLANGGDHHEIQRDLPDLLEDVRRAHPDAAFGIDRYDRYLDSVRPMLPELETIEGELLGSREAFILRGVNSARMPIKLRHERTERGLQVAETLASLAMMARGAAVPRAGLAYAWRELLRNSPHDSVTGCSTDAVHDGMLDRYARADQVTDRIRVEALAALVGRAAPWTPLPEPGAMVSLVNPLPVPRRAAVELALTPSLAGEGELVAERPEGLLPVQLLGDGASRRAVVVVDVPAFGSTSIALRRGTGGASGSARSTDGRTIENERLRVRVLDGSIELTDFLTGRTWRRGVWFEDAGDRGDEYTFRPLDGETRWTSLGQAPRVRVTASGPLVAELEARWVARLPRALAPDLASRLASTVRVPIRVRVRLVDGIDRVELAVTVRNRAADHRLRLRFDDPEPAAGVRAAGHLAVLRRIPGTQGGAAGWAEIPEPTSHAAGFVATGSLAILAPGIPEYEAMPRADGGLDLALTLLRCVGQLGRDLPSRTGEAGPAIPTPGAQCPGTHAFRIALVPLYGERDLDLVRLAEDHRVAVEIGPPGVHPPVPLAIEGEVAFSALKPAEDGNGAILRLWNPGPEPASVRILAPGWGIGRCRMDELPWTGAPAAPGETQIVLGSAEVATVRLATGA